MMKSKLFLGLLLAVAAPGCASVFTDIRANGDGSYTVTKTTQGVFRVYGEVYRCTPEGAEKLSCASIDRL